ncbi:penicillin acylase family protein [Collimonas antrihumi]|uniref:penicillin acylase family protein n=1 Tax=Collimonas antrihumi TaxID=1940615 RepID=UPI001B8D9255|nr:penicillin acylase family protein [Collimonas antrihumi]
MISAKKIALVLAICGIAASLPSVQARQQQPSIVHIAPHGAVTIKRDTYGTPHIYADTTFGLFYGYGYAVAQDRLFQMEMARRTFTGKVSEALGAKYLTSDQAVRSNYKPQSLLRQYAALPASDKAIFEGYAAGFNAWVRQVEKQPEQLMPKQFNDMGFKPVKWTAMDVVMIFVGSMANRFSDFNTELDNLGLLNALVEKHGKEDGSRIFDQLKWVDDPGAPTTIPSGPAERKVTGPAPAEQAVDNRQQLAGLAAPSRQTMQAIARMPRDAGNGRLLPMSGSAAQDHLDALLARDGLSGMGGFPQASNIWLAGKGKAKDAQAILFNGPQFGWFNPAYVYAVGLHGAGFNVVGNTPFAYPSILFGHNGKIAWGATAGYGDGVDIYQEQLNPDNRYEYLYKGKYLPMIKRTDIIKVKGAPDHKLDVYGTTHGLVVAFDMEKGVAYSKKRTWDGHEVESLMAWIRQTQAQDYDQWIGQAAHMAITINWYYADAKGNIGYAYTGKFPQRKPNHDTRLPALGTGDMEWDAVLPFSSNPQMLNPQQGWIANWNNKPAAGYPSPDMYWLSWSAADRVETIMDHFKPDDKLTPAAMAGINQSASFADVNARYFLPYLKEAVARLAENDPRRQAVTLFDGWDLQTVDSSTATHYKAAATLMRTWLPIMLKNTLADVIPAEYFKFYSAAGYPVAGTPVVGSVNIQPGTKVLYQALRGKHASIPQRYDLFNGKKPLDVVLAALSESVESLQTRYGSDMQKWLEPVDEHVYLSNNFVGIPQANGNERLKTPVMMNRGTENNLISFTSDGVRNCEVLPPGQSGFIAPDGAKSKHYEDQLELYKKFECKHTWLEPADVDRHLESKTVLEY